MMPKCQQCVYYPHCDEYPFDESGCDDFKDRSEFVEVVHGYNLNEYPSLFECSVCRWSDWDTYTGDTSVYNYCPNCGAKMDGGG
jgi:hypothetical protein